MISREAVICVCVLGLLLCLWLHLYENMLPQLLPSPIAHLQEVTKEQQTSKTMRDWISVPGEGLIPHIPCFRESFPACVPSGTAELHLFAFTLHILHSWSSHPALPFTAAECTFWQILSPVLTRDFLISHSKPQLIAVIPSFPTNHCKWISLTPWDL